MLGMGVRPAVPPPAPCFSGASSLSVEGGGASSLTGGFEMERFKKSASVARGSLLGMGGVTGVTLVCSGFL